MAGKVYLRAFGADTGKKYSPHKYGVKRLDKTPLELVNSIKPMSPQKIARMKKAFDKRAGSWLPMDRSGVWRYREFLPAFKPFYTIISLNEGNTPLYPMPRCASFCGIDEMLVKHQGYNPTGSIKDNAMASAISMAKLSGATAVACGSAGAASASMAAYAARAGMRSVAILPGKQVTNGNLSQCADFGAITILIDGNLSQAQDLVDELCEQKGVYSCNSGNPFCIEGVKTVAIEMLHQMEWNPPDWVIVPGGNLGTCTAFGKALDELKAAGFIDRIPRLAVAQPVGAPAFQDNSISEKSESLPFETRASAIKVGKPVHAMEANHYVNYTNGTVVCASETEIAIAKNHIGKDGVGSDPSSALTIAGCKNLCKQGTIKPDERVVCILTGNMLSDTEYTLDFHYDRLFLKPVRTVSVTGESRISTLGTFNMITRLPADAKTVIDFITKELRL